MKPPAKEYWPEGYEEWFVYFTQVRFTRDYKDATKGVLGMPLYTFTEGSNEIRIWVGPADSRCKVGSQKAFKKRLGSARRLKLTRKPQSNDLSLVFETADTLK